MWPLLQLVFGLGLHTDGFIYLEKRVLRIPLVRIGLGLHRALRGYFQALLVKPNCRAQVLPGTAKPDLPHPCEPGASARGQSVQILFRTFGLLDFRYTARRILDHMYPAEQSDVLTRPKTLSLGTSGGSN